MVSQKVSISSSGCADNEAYICMSVVCFGFAAVLIEIILMLAISFYTMNAAYDTRMPQHVSHVRIYKILWHSSDAVSLLEVDRLSFHQILQLSILPNDLRL